MPKNILVALACMLAATLPASAQDTPKALSEKLSQAIQSKDLSAAEKLVEWDDAPVAAYRIFKMSIADCFTSKCGIEVAKITEDEKKPQEDYHFIVMPEGKIKLTGSDGSEGFSMPFAKLNDTYRIILGQQTDQAYKEAKAATDVNKIANQLDPDLVSSGEALPADGGTLSETYRQYIAALKKGDTEYLAQHGTSGDRYFFGKAYKENPIKRQIALDLAQLEGIAEPKIEGGFKKDNRAMLLVSGTNGQGWTTKGAVTLLQEGDKWVMEDKSYLSYPEKKNS